MDSTTQVTTNNAQHHVYLTVKPLVLRVNAIDEQIQDILLKDKQNNGENNEVDKFALIDFENALVSNENLLALPQYEKCRELVQERKDLISNINAVINVEGNSVALIGIET